eukprot:763128-Hanusia_phi.AAC.3
MTREERRGEWERERERGGEGRGGDRTGQEDSTREGKEGRERRFEMEVRGEKGRERGWGGRGGERIRTASRPGNLDPPMFAEAGGEGEV